MQLSRKYSQLLYFENSIINQVRNNLAMAAHTLKKSYSGCCHLAVSKFQLEHIQQNPFMRAAGPRACLENDEFTFFNPKAVAPLLQGDVLILVGVTLLKEASYAMFHGYQRCSQRSKL